MFRSSIFIILLGVFLILQGCTAVKPYQRVFLNDAEMQMGNSYGGAFGDYVHGIRTGSVIAGSKKSSGGCGCN
jgi:hypothetical protein